MRTETNNYQNGASYHNHYLISFRLSDTQDFDKDVDEAVEQYKEEHKRIIGDLIEKGKDLVSSAALAVGGAYKKVRYTLILYSCKLYYRHISVKNSMMGSIGSDNRQIVLLI